MDSLSYIGMGNDEFRSVVNDEYYVDKTGLICEINRIIDTRRRLICVTRPRRFGKTSAAVMLQAYYDKSCDSKSLFDGLEVSESADYTKHLNQYDVIYLDMGSHAYYGESDEVVRRINDSLMRDVLNYASRSSSDKNLIETLSDIATGQGRKFIMIIDEWDIILRENKFSSDIRQEFIEWMRMMFKTRFTSRAFACVYMTGILPIVKYNSESALSDFKEYTMLDRPGPGRLALSRCFGFTEEEVQGLLKDSQLKFADLQDWYDGYTIGGLHLYNPNSVVESLQKGYVENYWACSKPAVALEHYIFGDFEGLRGDFLSLLDGKSVRVESEVFANDYHSIKGRNDVLVILVHLGYLIYNPDTSTVAIPNKEIASYFHKVIRENRSSETYALVRDSAKLLEDTIAGDTEAVVKAIEAAHASRCGPKLYNNEEALRSVIHLAYFAAIDEYIRVLEMPAGKGFADVIFIPKKYSGKPALVVELKWNRSAKGAISQIKRNQYPEALKGFGADILLVGINYSQKTKHHTCKIERYPIPG